MFLEASDMWLYASATKAQNNILVLNETSYSRLKRGEIITLIQDYDNLDHIMISLMMEKERENKRRKKANQQNALYIRR